MADVPCEPHGSPDLQFVPTAALQPHESVDERRVEPLVHRLRQDGMLRNPPVVLPASDRSGTYVVLDGANRTMALRRLAIGHALVQVAHAGATAVDLRTWNHIILGVPTTDLSGLLQRYPEIALVASDRERAAFNLSAGGALAYLEQPDGQVVEVVGETEPLPWRVRNLNYLVGSYQGVAQVERTSADRGERVAHLHPGFSGLIVFRQFRMEEVVTAAARSWLLPAGLTCFVISPRALRVNYPLEKLARDQPLTDRQGELQAWLQLRMEGRHVRFYAEATFLFDE